MAGAQGRRGNKRIVKTIIILMILAALGYVGYRVYGGVEGSKKADETMKTLESIIPGLGAETDGPVGMGRDPLASLTVNDLDIVGVIEIPAVDINAPVTAKGISEEFFATWLDGSPVKGNFQIIARRADLFRRISKLKPGDRVIFTDIEGVRYEYSVTTQYHLKKWDEGDNDLLLCCESDSDTYFVVGCTAQ